MVFKIIMNLSVYSFQFIDRPASKRLVLTKIRQSSYADGIVTTIAQSL